MNRSAALLLALTTLLAHSLLIHQDSRGNFAAPYEYAHVAFRLARNLVHEGSFTWNVGMPWAESYPSPLWVFICSIAERVYAPVTTFAQGVGIVCALAVVGVSAQFTRDRLAGVIAPLLLVVNGGLAAAGPGGSETALLTLLIVTSFLAYEERWRTLLTLALALLCITRPEGFLFLLVLFSFEIVRSRRKKGPHLLPCFVFPLALATLLFLLRWARGDSPFSANMVGLFQSTGEMRQLGMQYVGAFFISNGSPFLVVIPLIYLVSGRMKGRGRRALLLSLFWMLLVVWKGGDRLPFWNAMVPTLPLLFVAVQDGITMTMDSQSRVVRVGSIALLALGMIASTLASKVPGKIGVAPVFSIRPLGASIEGELAEAYERPPGRLGLIREINETERLRSVGVYLRDNLPPRSTLVTPWPGAIGYLSRLKVFDLLGRATPSRGRSKPKPWYGVARVNLIDVVQQEPDYFLAWVDPASPPPSVEDLMRDWLRRYDTNRATEAGLADLMTLMEEYELIAIPVPVRSTNIDVISEAPAYLLRRLNLRLTPRVNVELDGREFHVTARQRGHQQLVDLEVRVRDVHGRVWHMRPTGKLVLEEPVRARLGIRLFSTGSRPVELMTGFLPTGLEAAQISVVLRVPGSDDPLFSEISNRKTIPVPR